MKWFVIEAVIVLVLVACSYGMSHNDPKSIPTSDLTEYSGQLARMSAPGGETTGSLLKLADGQSIEVDMKSHDLNRHFRVGKTVAVQGYYRQIKGIKIPEREVFVVTRIGKPQVAVQGVFETVRAAGGETTGTGLMLTDGKVVEVDLQTNNLTRKFRPGSAVKVMGSYRVIKGMVIAERKVLVAESIQ